MKTRGDGDGIGDNTGSTGTDGTDGIGDGSDGSDGSDSGSGDSSGDGGTSSSWQCNWRDQLHDNPEDCNNPSAGGTWIIILSPPPRTDEMQANPNAMEGEEDDCPECITDSDGGIGINAISISTMRSTLKNNLDLSTAGISFLANSDIIVTELYYFYVQHLEFDIISELDIISSEAKTYAENIIKAGANGSLISASPFVKYPEGSNFETLYPKTTAILKNDLPKIANNQKVIDAIHGITEAPKDKIKEALQWGKGPEIHIQQLGGEGDGEKYGTYKGHVDNRWLNMLFLDIDLVNDFENSETTEISDAFAFLIAVTILHEYNHLGDHIFGNSFWGTLYDNDPLDTTNEAGLVFEEDVFGMTVWRSNAGLVLAKTGGF